MKRLIFALTCLLIGSATLSVASPSFDNDDGKKDGFTFDKSADLTITSEVFVLTANEAIIYKEVNLKAEKPVFEKNLSFDANLIKLSSKEKNYECGKACCLSTFLTIINTTSSNIDNCKNFYINNYKNPDYNKANESVPTFTTLYLCR